MFAKIFGCSRFIWNKMLEDRKRAWKEEHITLLPRPAQYKDDFPWLKEVDCMALCNVQVNLEQVYNNHFDNPKHFDWPKFKAKRSHQSYTTNCIRNNIRFEGKDQIQLPKIGLVKIKKHREPEEGWKLKSATVSMTSSGEYFISVLFELEKDPATDICHESRIIGLDYKSDGFYTDSDGHTIGSPKYYRKEMKRLKREQRRLARKWGFRKGETASSNFRKQQFKVGRIYEKAANQRKNFAHQQSRKIANSYDVVCVEDLNLKAILQRLWQW